MPTLRRSEAGAAPSNRWERVSGVAIDDTGTPSPRLSAPSLGQKKDRATNGLMKGLVQVTDLLPLLGGEFTAG